LEINVDTGKILEKNYEILVLGIFEEEKYQGVNGIIDKALGKEISQKLKTSEFNPKLKKTCLITTYGKIGIKRILLVGLGKRKDFSPESIRMASSSAINSIQELGITSCTFSILGDNAKILVEQIVENTVVGCELALYQFNLYKTEDQNIKKINKLLFFVDTPKSVGAVKSSISIAQIMDNGVNLARNLSNMPSSDATPTQIAEKAKIIADESGMTFSVLNKKEMEKFSMGGIINVSKGSSQPPKLVILEHKGGGTVRPIVLVGKGITFDSGGISLKHSEKMEEMKHDKAGAATVIGIMQTVAQLKLPLNVIGITPLTENLPGGSAYKPGDVLKMCNGKTVEVINTDAEGRLILADALAFASRYKPQAVIDLATLTGACVIALGSFATGLLGNDDNLKKRITSGGEITGERVWELPLWDDYKELLKSDVADMKNVGGRPGGVITAASFLSNFVDYPWVHLDIAGTAWTQSNVGVKPYNPKGATGVGVRLITEVLRFWES
jgi:leucyl aminopeptidase